MDVGDAVPVSASLVKLPGCSIGTGNCADGSLIVLALIFIKCSVLGADKSSDGYLEGYAFARCKGNSLKLKGSDALFSVNGAALKEPMPSRSDLGRV